MSNNFKKDFLKSGIRYLMKLRILSSLFMLIILGLGTISLASGFKHLYPISIAVILLLSIYLYRAFKMERKISKEQDDMISENFSHNRAEKLIKFNKFFRKAIGIIFFAVMIYLMYLLFKAFYIFRH